jgi:hypothetical protein
MHDLLLALELHGHSGWVLGQEGELPGCFNAGTDLLPVECYDGTIAAAEGTASGTGVDADAGAGAGDLT